MAHKKKDASKKTKMKSGHYGKSYGKNKGKMGRSKK